MAYLNWPFALGYLLITLIVLVLCAWLQRRLRRSPD
jgi:flagellar biogenesis protein FliO